MRIGRGLLAWILCGLMAVLVCGLLAGCERRGVGTGEGFQVSIETRPSPPRVGTGEVVVKLADAAGQPVQGAEVSIEGTMAHAGMASSHAVMAPAEQPGHYPGRIDWTMGGDWILIIRVKPPGGPPFERRIDVPGVQSPP